MGFNLSEWALKNRSLTVYLMIIAVLAGLFGDRASQPHRPALAPLPWAGREGDSSIRVVMREKQQAALAMAFPGPARRDLDRAPRNAVGRRLATDPVGHGVTIEADADPVCR
jgi:hypothetical protein